MRVPKDHNSLEAFATITIRKNLTYRFIKLCTQSPHLPNSRLKTYAGEGKCICVQARLKFAHIVIRPTWSPRTHPIYEQRRHAVTMLQRGTAIGINLQCPSLHSPPPPSPFARTHSLTSWARRGSVFVVWQISHIFTCLWAKGTLLLNILWLNTGL